MRPKKQPSKPAQAAAHPQVAAAADQAGSIGAHEHGIQENTLDQPKRSDKMQGRPLRQQAAGRHVRAHRRTPEQALQLFGRDQGLSASHGLKMNPKVVVKF